MMREPTYFRLATLLTARCRNMPIAQRARDLSYAVQRERLRGLELTTRELPWLRDVDDIASTRAVGAQAPRTRVALLPSNAWIKDITPRLGAWVVMRDGSDESQATAAGPRGAWWAGRWCSRSRRRIGVGLPWTARRADGVLIRWG